MMPPFNQDMLRGVLNAVELYYILIFLMPTIMGCRLCQNSSLAGKVWGFTKLVNVHLRKSQWKFDVNHRSITISRAY